MREHKIQISGLLRGRIPEIRLYGIGCDVVVAQSADLLLKLMDEKCSELHASLKVEDISQIPAISGTRKAYRATGKDPARYRPSAEALLRRIIRGENLYRINNVVDLLNLVSVSTGFSIGGYDDAKIIGDIQFSIGEDGEHYSGIGRGVLNIDGLPVFRDRNGAFGSPTSDSERCSVSKSTRKFLMVIIDFGLSKLLPDAAALAMKLLTEFAHAENMETEIIV